MTFEDKIPALIAVLLILLAGIICLLLPAWLRKYDTRMTRYIKDKEEYVFTMRFFGLVLIILALGVLALLPYMDQFRR